MTLSDGALRHIRLGSGLVMLAYIVLHMANHTLGIVSLPAAEAGLSWSLWLWHTPVGTVVLYGAFVLHLMLALRTIYLRRHWQLPATEWFRLWAGFSLPLLLITHVVGTRVATTFYGFAPDYEKVIASIIDGNRAGWQLALLAPGWVHGCLGLWIGFQRHPLAQRAKPVLIAILMTVPVLSAIGFARMMTAVEAQTDGVMRHALAARPDAAALGIWRQALLVAYVTAITVTFVAGRLRRARRFAP
jgi:adenylate cyclase